MTSVTRVGSATVQDVKYARLRDDEQDERAAKVQRTKEEALSPNEAAVADKPERKIESLSPEPQPSTTEAQATGGIVNGAKKAAVATVNVTGRVIKKTVDYAPKLAKITAAGALACPNEFTAATAAIAAFLAIPEVQELAGESAQASIDLKL